MSFFIVSLRFLFFCGGGLLLLFDFGFQHLEDIFIKTIIPALTLVGYELIIANSALHARWVTLVVGLPCLLVTRA